MKPLNEMEFTQCTVNKSSNDNNEEGIELLKLFDEIGESINCVKVSLTSLNDKVCKKEISSAKGISLLEVKNQMLLSYLSNLMYTILRKCCGKSIAGDRAIERLVEIRTIIERMQPIENKLKYQIDKLVKTAVTGTCDKNDPKHFRANPNNLADGIAGNEVNSDDEDDNNDGDDDTNDNKNVEKSDKAKSGIYVPPKLVAVHYDGDNSEASKKERMLERARKRALNSSIVQELQDEFLDNPVEVGDSLSFKPKRSKFAKEKEEYEETYFTRLSTSKKEKHKSRSMLTSGNLKGLTNFEDISVLDNGLHYSGEKKKKGKRTITKKKKGFKKKKKIH